MQFRTFDAKRLNGTVIPNATVYVYLAGTTTEAALFDEDGVSLGDQPLYTTNRGVISFAAANGEYDIVFTQGGLTATLENVQFLDLLSLDADDLKLRDPSDTTKTVEYDLSDLLTGTSLEVNVGKRATYKNVGASEPTSYPSRAYYLSGGDYWLLDEDAPTIAMFATTETEGITFDTGTQTATGDDWTAATQAWIDYILERHLGDRPVGSFRPTLPDVKAGAGIYRISGSVDGTQFGQLNRRAVLDFAGCQFVCDGAGKIAFDFTDAQWLTIKNFWAVGCDGSKPYQALRIGRKGTTDTASNITIINSGTWNSTTSKSSFIGPAFANIGSELAVEINNYWSNDNTAGGAYGGAYDCINVTSYDDPQTVTAATNANPAVFTIAGHGLSDDDIVVPRDFSGFSIDSKAWVVDNATTNTFTLKDRTTGTALDGTSAGTFVSGEFCKENYGSEYTDDRAAPYSAMSFLGFNCISTTWRSAGATAFFMGQHDGSRVHGSYAIGTTYPCRLGYLDGIFSDVELDIHSEHPTSGNDYTSNFFIEGYASDATVSFADCLLNESKTHADTYFLDRATGVTTINFRKSKVTCNANRSGVTPDFVRTSANWNFVECDVTVPTEAQANFTAGQISGSLAYTNSATVWNFNQTFDAVTIAANAITISGSQHIEVDTTGGPATLKTINFPSIGIPNGYRIRLRIAPGGSTLTLDETGNLQLNATTIDLTNVQDGLDLEKNGANWRLVAPFADNA